MVSGQCLQPGSVKQASSNNQEFLFKLRDRSALLFFFSCDSDFSLLGIILAVAFLRMKRDKGQHNAESAQASETKPLRN